MALIKDMKDGDIGYAVSWAAYRDENDKFFLNGEYRCDRRMSSANMLIRRSDGKYVIDKTPVVKVHSKGIAQCPMGKGIISKNILCNSNMPGFDAYTTPYEPISVNVG